MSMFFLPPPSPEDMEQMRRAQEEAQMRNEAFRHEIDEWIESLGPRETFMLKVLLVATVDDTKWTCRTVGELNGMLKYKHQVDPDTGKPEGAELFEGEGETTP